MYLWPILVVKVGLVPVHGLCAGVAPGLALQVLLCFMVKFIRMSLDVINII